MSKTYEVSIFVQVRDAAELHAHAMDLATTGQGSLSKEEAESMLGTQAEPDVRACLRWVFDPGQSPPGTSIEDSVCSD